ncbi:MAG: TIGR03790 family protein [Verrucomicrobia bacterium]|nr:TIGR03790 family protein [Verrucomicrobiota bacterium]
MRFFLSIAALVVGATAFTPQPARADGSEVLVVYNSKLRDSKSVAEHYAGLRGVPKSQVLGFALTTNNAMTRADFRDSLQKPLLRKLQSSKLWRFGPGEVPGTNGQMIQVEDKLVQSKIRYLVLCYGVPYQVVRDGQLKETIESTLRPEFRRNEAAVDSELAWLPMIHRDLPLAGPLGNPLYTVTNTAFMHPTNGVLMVTRLDGPSAEIARGLVDKAIQAETDGLWGRAYIDLRNTTDPGMKQGDDWLRGAAELCRRLGFDTVVDEQENTFPASLPMSHIAFYAGWYRERVEGPFNQPEVEFMPGAFAYHLHSFSAASLRTTDRNWTGPLLARGATISMGTVDEPYLGATPDIATFTARLLYHGFTFGEAAYAGQNVLSWQTTVVGDPLYRPFGKHPALVHQELERKGSKLVEWSHLRVVNLNLARGTPVREALNYLESIPTTKASAVLSEKLGELCTAQGKPASAIAAYERALTLNPSPQQRIRLRLTLGEKLAEADQNEDAYANYQKLAQESPDYPDMISIARKLRALAQQLGKTEDVTKYEAQIKLLAAPPPAKS